MSIKSIDVNTVNRICSGQVVVSIQTAVKELVENALDAGARSIQIKLKDYGAEEIEVSDDGSGIEKDDFKHLCTRHATSKIEKFDDLENVMSFGFRGEALSSLCALSDYLEVRTRTEASEIGYRLRYNRRGELISEESMARPKGTSIVVRELFKPQPVRRVQFKKNLKRHYASLLSVLQSYAIISKSVRFVCTNRAKTRTTALSTSGASKILDNIASVFGIKFMKTLRPFEMNIYDEQDIEKDETLSGAKVCGFVSKMSQGITLSNSGRQIIFVNGRPTDLPKVTRVLNQTWRHFEMSHKPGFVLDVRLPPGHADYNVTPDKRTILIVNEALLLTRLGTELSKLWEPSRFTYKVRSIESSLTSSTPSARSSVSTTNVVANNVKEMIPVVPAAVVNADNVKEIIPVVPAAVVNADNVKEMTPVVPAAAASAFTTAAETTEAVNTESKQESVNTSTSGSKLREALEETRTKPEDGRVKRKRSVSSANDSLLTSVKSDTLSTKEEESDDENDDFEKWKKRRTVSSVSELLLASKSSSNMAKAIASAASAGLTSAAIVSPSRRPKAQKRSFSFRDNLPARSKPQHICAPNCNCDKNMIPRVNVSVKKRSRSEIALEPPKAMNISLETLRKYVSSLTTSSESVEGNERIDTKEARTSFEGLGTNDVKDVEARFERVFQKKYFRDMEILGQFNLGFIVARLGHDLFILDQHACDEKFNFERLHRDAKMHSQRLIQPRTLHVSAQDEMIIMEHVELFRKSGFDIEIDENAAVGKRLKICGLSHCMGASLGIEDLNEYASVLQDWTSVKGSKPPKLPKLDRLFASRACRSSVMIGMALDRRRMISIVRNLETLDQPWNCPHGRPTMRHLYDMRNLSSKNTKKRRRRVFSHLDSGDDE